MQKLSIRDVSSDETYYSGVQSEPVSLSEAKQWLIVESAFTDDDNLILTLISQARSTIENFCNISILTKQVTITFSYNTNLGPYKKDWDRNFFGTTGDPGDWYDLPWGPTSTIYSVTGIDRTSITPMILNQDYFIQGQLFKQIQFASFYPTIIAVYQVGYPRIPQKLKEAILAEISFSYENRGDNTNRYASQNVGLSERAEYLAKDFMKIQV